MRAKTVRTGAVGLLAGVVLGATAPVGTPAVAAPNDHLTTLRGTVTEEDGHHLAGIRVTAGPYEGSSITSVKTDVHGRYVVRITAGSALYMKFEDPSHLYFTATKDRFAAHVGSTHRVNRTLHRIATIAGTVRDRTGSPLPHATVRAYGAAAGKRTSWSTRTDHRGHFHLRIEGGRYRLRFAATGVRAEWYGDARTRAASPAIAVSDGATRHRIDAVLDRTDPQ